MKKKQKVLFLKYGVNEYNNLVHISSVKSGKACNCKCPGCGGTLIARKGNRKAWHFAHEHAECQYGYQTSLHLLGKSVLEKCKYIVVENITYPIDEIYLEKSEGDYIPDVTIISNGIKYHIEIYVTHKTDGAKIMKLYRNGVTTFEVDLSNLDREADARLLYKVFTGTKDIYDKKIHKWISVDIECINDTDGHNSVKQDLIYTPKSTGIIDCPLFNKKIPNKYCYCCLFNGGSSLLSKIANYEKNIYLDIQNIKDICKREEIMDTFRQWSILYRDFVSKKFDTTGYTSCSKNIKPNTQEYYEKHILDTIDMKQKISTLIENDRKFEEHKKQMQMHRLRRIAEKNNTFNNSVKEYNSKGYQPVNILEL